MHPPGKLADLISWKHSGFHIHDGGEKPPPKEILPTRPGELRSRLMKTAVISPDSAKSRHPTNRSLFQRFSFQHFNVTQAAHQPQAHIPALRSGSMALSGGSRRKQISSPDRLSSVFSALGEKANCIYVDRT
jgi:hypothetical protein